MLVERVLEICRGFIERGQTIGEMTAQRVKIRNEPDSPLPVNGLSSEYQMILDVLLDGERRLELWARKVSIGLNQPHAAENTKEGRFAILSSPKSTIKGVADLKGATLGISQNSIIDYVSDKMLIDKGVQLNTVKKISIPKMPVRVDMLLSDQINAACLPDPLAALAQKKGAHLIVDDTYRNISQTVFVFRTKSIQENPEGIKAAVRVYGSAGQALTKNPDQYRTLFLEKAQIPSELKESYKTPTFSKLQLPTDEEISSVMKWMVDKKLISKAYSYQELVDTSLLTK